MLSLATLILLAATAELGEPKAPVAPAVPTVQVPTAKAPESRPAAGARASLTAPSSPTSSDAGVSAPSAAVKPVAATGAGTAPGGSEDVNDLMDAARASPPSVTEHALCDELRRGARTRMTHAAQLDAEKKALAAERTKLEALAAEVQRARVSLKEETARLEGLLKKQGAEPHDERPRVADALRGLPLEKGSIEGIAKAVHSMKPEQGAQLLARLDRSLASEVLRKMKPADVGAVMEKLKPELAAELVSMMVVALPSKEAKP